MIKLRSFSLAALACAFGAGNRARLDARSGLAQSRTARKVASLKSAAEFDAIADSHSAFACALHRSRQGASPHPRCLNCHPPTRSPTQGDDDAPAYAADSGRRKRNRRCRPRIARPAIASSNTTLSEAASARCRVRSTGCWRRRAWRGRGGHWARSAPAQGSRSQWRPLARRHPQACEHRSSGRMGLASGRRAPARSGNPGAVRRADQCLDRERRGMSRVRLPKSTQLRTIATRTGGGRDANSTPTGVDAVEARRSPARARPGAVPN